MKLAKLLLSGLLVFALTSSVLAKPMANVDNLRRIAKAEEQRHDLLRGASYQKLKMTIKAKGLTPDGRQFELMGVKPDGRPLFMITDNANAARTISTFPLLPGGTSGLDLTGSGTLPTQLAVWDGGAVRATHVEFTGRLTLVDNVSFSDHSTHVAGTMIAAGLDAAARGMSPAAEMSSYDWTNDTNEMAEAAINGLQISNHSYGYIRGWSYGDYGSGSGWYWFGDIAISQTEDFMFGFYSDESRAFDMIAYNAPDYLIVKSAGNDRGDVISSTATSHYYMNRFGNWVLATGTGNREADGGSDGYDCVGDVASSKNILTVGAIKDMTSGYSSPSDFRSSQIESYSSFGPTDDGRVKPDIMGNGEQLYSTLSTSDASYGYMSGTSMATPNVSGSVNLLARFYESTHQETPRAATLKAIVLHTADDDMSFRGPDFRSGWGMMNTSSAIELIDKDTTDTMTISEQVLMDGESQAWTFSSDGTEPLKITIAWTDPPGVAGANQLNNRTPKLVNDLDIWVAGPNDELYYPWTLDPENPLQLAKRDKPNHVDNVEQVVVDTPAVGQFTAYIMHDGTLTDGEQAYSMIVTGTNSNVEVASIPHSKTPALPSDFAILGSYPNPFNPTTSVRVAMPESGNLTVRVYNVLGEEVATLVDGLQSAGVHSYLFNGAGLPSGLYFVRAVSDRFGAQTHKMALVR